MATKSKSPKSIPYPIFSDYPDEESYSLAIWDYIKSRRPISAAQFANEFPRAFSGFYLTLPKEAQIILRKLCANKQLRKDFSINYDLSQPDFGLTHFFLFYGPGCNQTADIFHRIAYPELSKITL